MFPRIKIEYIAQGIDPKTRVIKYQSAGPDEGHLIAWFKDHAVKGKFAGLECNIKKRYLVNGRVFHVEQKHILWLLIIVLLAFNLWVMFK